MKIMFFVLLSPFILLFGTLIGNSFTNAKKYEAGFIVGIITLLAFWAFYFI